MTSLLQPTPAFLLGGGPSGERIMNQDWTGTPLGSLEHWSPTLRTVVGMMLNSAMPTLLCWGNEQITLSNDAALPLLGGQPALGTPLAQLRVAGLDAIAPLVSAAFQGQPAYTDDLPVRSDHIRGGEHRTCRFSCSPVRDDSGAVAGVLCAIIEVSDKVRAIAGLREQEDTLRHLHARLADKAAAYAADRDRVWRISHDIMAAASLATGKFLTVNPAFTQTFGWSEEEATSCPFMEMVYPDDRCDVIVQMQKLATTGEPLVRYNTRVMHKDGSHRWVCWTIVPEGELLYGVARDITAEKQQADALRLTEEALRQSQKMEAVGQLTGGLAHDFNNMLAGVSGNLELMKLRLRMGQSDDLIQRIDSAIGITKRAAALTHRLLAFSRRQALDPKPTRVNELIVSMTELIRHSTGPSIRIRTELSTDLWTTRCDPNQLENALLNLANNARDAMPGGGELLIETRNITLCPAQAAQYGDIGPGEYIAILVSDDGVGMEPTVAARAFDPFFTTKPLGHGTGLGLSMVYGFAQQSGGHVRISSTPGNGTNVLLRLPRHLEVQPSKAEADSHVADESIPGSATVLIVEDETEVREVMADALRLQGYTVVAVADASAAMRQLRSAPMPDILVTDIGLPGNMNGRQLADQVRAAAPALPVLLVTGYAEGTVMKNESLPAQMELLTKPFALTALVAKVGQMTGQRGQRTSPMP